MTETKQRDIVRWLVNIYIWWRTLFGCDV